MGSRQTHYWHKKWIPIKQSLEMTSEQRSVIIGSLLGDGTMRIGKGSVNANFKIEHGLLQKEYVDWKFNMLRSFVFTEPKISYRYSSDRQKYAKSWWFRTVRHPLLTRIYWDFYTGESYRTGTKIIPSNLQSLLNPLVLAVWIMDDGSYSNGRIDISTYSFSLYEVEYLARCFYERFSIKMNYYRDRDKGLRMYGNQDETRKLVQIIKPFTIPSLTYKIGLTTP